MKIERLLAMTILLLNRRKMTAKDLADYFEVSIRTIYRDVETLNRAHIPIVSFQGYDGGFCIPDHYKLSRQLLTFSDMLAILTTLKGVNLTLKNKEVDLAIEKITALIPTEKQAQYQQHQTSFLIDISPWGSQDKLQKTIAKVHEGVNTSRVLEFEYTPASGTPILRRVEPHTLIFKGFGWYLLGFCRLRKAFRVFKLARMRSLCKGPEHFVRRPVDPGAHFRPENDPRPPIEMILKFPARIIVKIEETLGRECIIEKNDNHIMVCLSMPEDDWVHSFILSHGENVEVMSPPRLRRAIEKKILKMKKNYTNLT